MIKTTSIKIGVKIKPTPSKSISQCIIKSSRQQGSLPTVALSIGGTDSKTFQVDAVHDANSSKQSMFVDLNINQLVQKFVNGFNATVIAYGQTGAGKTYCMEGNKQENGIIHDSIKMIYEKIKPQSVVTCSYIQLYNQKIFDLLAEEPNIDGLKLRWQIQRDFVVQDLSIHTARTSKDMQRILAKGLKNRIIASNRIHDYSSRSHALFFINVSDRDQEDCQRYRQMTFVDLAGSERLFDHYGKLSKESIEINKSLFSLRKVIKILQQSTTQRKQLYIPYRDSKLTSLLKKAFGGNCLTMMIACIDSTLEHKQQTILTLSYAISTGRIQNSAQINIDHQAFQNRMLKNQNQKLNKQLDTAWRQIDFLHKKEKVQAEKKSLHQYSHKIIQCIGTIRELIKSNKQLREQLQQQRRVKRQQKMQIQMLMQQRYMLRKFNSLNQSPSPRRYQTSMHLSQNINASPESNNPNNVNSSTTQILPTVQQKQEVSPHKIIRIREILGSSISSFSPVKNQLGVRRGNNTRRPNNSVTKRQKYIYNKTQPDLDEILEYRPPRSDKNVKN